MTSNIFYKFWYVTTSWLTKHNWQKHPLVIPVVFVLVLSFIMMIVFISSRGKPVVASDSHVVTISHDKKQETIPTRAKTVGELLKRADIKLNDGDIVEPSQDTEILDDKFRVNIYRARPVTVIDGAKKTFSFSAASTPRSVASQAGVEVFPEDKVKSEMETNFLKDGSIGEKIVVDRATPANLNLYGTPIALRSHANTVRSLLSEKKVELAKDDTVQPALDTELTPNMQIFVVRNGSKVVTEEHPIPMETQTIEDASLSFGATAIRQKGAPGVKVITFQIDMQNDKEVGRKEIQSIVSREPVKQIVARGKAFDISKDKASVMAAAGISPSDYPYVDYIVSRESGWRVHATNGRTWGLCQALPGSKMASAGADWQTNPVTQLRWCSSYAAGKGGWKASYDIWVSKHWW